MPPVNGLEVQWQRTIRHHERRRGPLLREEYMKPSAVIIEGILRGVKSNALEKKFLRTLDHVSAKFKRLVLP
jgi:hypothetical protein